MRPLRNLHTKYSKTCVVQFADEPSDQGSDHVVGCARLASRAFTSTRLPSASRGKAPRCSKGRLQPNRPSFLEHAIHFGSSRRLRHFYQLAHNEVGATPGSLVSMSNLRARNPGEPSQTPTRNFSHPKRQRASSLSPEHNQDNPLLTINDSRYMLPILPSGILRSTSIQSLQTEQDRHADFDFGYESQVRSETSYTTFSARSVPDLNATALPPMPNRKAPPIHQQYAASASAPPAVTINPPSPSRSIRRPHPSPTKSGKSGKGCKWGRWSMRVKTVFRFKCHKKSTVQAVLPPMMDDSEPPAPAMNIGGPSVFRHLTSGTTEDLRAPDTGLFASPHWRAPVYSSGEMRSVMIGDGLGISGLDQPSSSTYHAGQGVSEAGPRGENSYAGLGYQDVDDTAVSDDGNSEWEDDEGSRLFLEYQKRKDRHSFNPR